MADNDIIEIRSKSLGIMVEAGIVVRDGHRFRFYAATHAFNSLEGRLFKSPKAAEAAALRHIVERSTGGRFDGIDVPHKRESNATSHCVSRECHTACEAVSQRLRFIRAGRLAAGTAWSDCQRLTDEGVRAGTIAVAQAISREVNSVTTVRTGSRAIGEDLVEHGAIGATGPRPS
jgi:hypothetical protein